MGQADSIADDCLYRIAAEIVNSDMERRVRFETTRPRLRSAPRSLLAFGRSCKYTLS